MKVLLLEPDSKIPNLALTRIAAHHIDRGDDVWVERRLIPDLFDERWDQVYMSIIFKWSRPLTERLRVYYPTAIIGGTGFDETVKLEDFGIMTKRSDYSCWPYFKGSIGFTQRGCRLKCGFCVVPKKEGAVREEATINQIWRGEPYPKELLILDNDFFGQENWRQRIKEIRDGDFKVSFNQGINIRFITDEAAEAIASVQYYDDQFKHRRIYTAWDNAKDEHRVREGIEKLMSKGVAPSHIMVYMLVGYWSNETAAGRDYRRAVLRSYGVLPYPMPFRDNKTVDELKELVGFQRWVLTRYDRHVSWEDWRAAGYQANQLKWD